MKYFFLVTFFLASALAFADTTPVAPKVDYSQEAISNRLTAEINANIQLNAALLAANDKIKELQEKVDKLDPPKPVEPKAEEKK